MPEGKSEEEIRKFVEGELRKSGFPLETDLSSFLEERAWSVASSAFYVDHDSGKEGEIDLVASKTLTSDAHGKTFDPYELRLTLVIECKTSDEYHWVFFPRPRRDDRFEFDAGLIYTDFVHFARTRSLLPLMFPSLGILPPTVAGTLIDTYQMRIAHPRNLRCLMAQTKSRQYDEVPRKNMPRNMKVHEVATGLLKATWHEADLSTRLMTMSFEMLSKRQQSPSEVKWPINLFLPIAVFDGGIWTWVKRLEKTDGVLLQESLSPPNYLPISALICVVNKDRFLRLITEIEDDLHKIADLVNANLESLNKQRATIAQNILGTLG